MFFSLDLDKTFDGRDRETTQWTENKQQAVINYFSIPQPVVEIPQDFHATAAASDEEAEEDDGTVAAGAAVTVAAFRFSSRRRAA